MKTPDLVKQSQVEYTKKTTLEASKAIVIFAEKLDQLLVLEDDELQKFRLELHKDLMEIIYLLFHFAVQLLRK